MIQIYMAGVVSHTYIKSGNFVSIFPPIFQAQQESKPSEPICPFLPFRRYTSRFLKTSKKIPTTSPDRPTPSSTALETRHGRFKGQWRLAKEVIWRRGKTKPIKLSPMNNAAFDSPQIESQYSNPSIQQLPGSNPAMDPRVGQ